MIETLKTIYNSIKYNNELKDIVNTKVDEYENEIAENQIKKQELLKPFVEMFGEETANEDHFNYLGNGNGLTESGEVNLEINKLQYHLEPLKQLQKLLTS